VGRRAVVSRQQQQRKQCPLHGGAQAGVNYQLNQFVVDIEGDGQELVLSGPERRPCAGGMVSQANLE
jgi:hypothetical protein